MEAAGRSIPRRDRALGPPPPCWRCSQLRLVPVHSRVRDLIANLQRRLDGGASCRPKCTALNAERVPHRFVVVQLRLSSGSWDKGGPYHIQAQPSPADPHTHLASFSLRTYQLTRAKCASECGGSVYEPEDQQKPQGAHLLSPRRGYAGSERAGEASGRRMSASADLH